LTIRAGDLDMGGHLGIGSAGIGGRLERVLGIADDSIMAQPDRGPRGARRFYGIAIEVGLD
jgi:hypothetical protein